MCESPICLYSIFDVEMQILKLSMSSAIEVSRHVSVVKDNVLKN